MEVQTLEGGVAQILILLCVLVPAILFLLTQYRTLNLIRLENREMNSGLIWIQLIPFVGLVWQFFVVSNIAGSIRREILSRQGDSILGISDVALARAGETKPTLGIGIAYCCLLTAGVFFNLFAVLPLQISALCNLAGVVCWIIYWVQLAKYKKLISIGI